MDSDGFTIVKSKKKHSKKIVEKRTTVLSSEDIVIDKETVKKRLKTAVADLEASEYFTDVKAALKIIENSPEAVYCFGLGHFGESVTAKYQLALLQSLQASLNLQPSQVFLSDPIFYKSEIEFLRSEGFNVLTENIECRLPCDKPTLILLPHCPKQLTNNLLHSNWRPESLKNIILISNSITNINHSSSLKFIEAVVDNNIVQEVELKNSFKYQDIFNDLSLHTFKITEDLSPSVWSLPAPDYSSEDLEYIRKKD